jgi:cathepsin A (carboxypeptidase C)
VVNFIGCSRVVDNLQTKYLADYQAATVSNFTGSDGKVAGWTKKAGKGAGNVAFVAFNNAGHMVSQLLGKSRMS